MSTSDNITSLSPSSFRSPETSAAEPIETPSAGHHESEPLTGGTLSRLEADDIYYSRDFGSRSLSASLRYLREALAEIEHAQQALISGDSLDADDRMNKTLVILQDVASHLRDAGEGFGIGAVALLCSVANLGGEPATEAQIYAVKKVARKLIAEPYLSSEDAAKETLILEEAGLNPDSGVVQGMIEALGDV